MLDWITIKGFKSISCIERLKLHSINVLIGPNGSGKSNFLEAFSFLNSVVKGNLQHYVGKAGGADRILHFGSKVTQNMTFHVSFAVKKGIVHYEIKLHSTEADSIFLLGERFFRNDQSKCYDELFTGGHKAALKQEKTAKEAKEDIDKVLEQYLEQFCVYQFHDTSSTSPMKRTAALNDNRKLHFDGSNLAAFLFLLQEKYKESYDLIRKTVQRIAPFFDDFQLAPQKLNPDKIRLEWQHIGTDAYFDLSSLSDGSLRFIALATLLLQPEELQPSTILLDEPELGLHPRAITMLASLIKQISTNKQVILATQSSLLLDHFQPEDVLIANRIEGGTTLKRLSSEGLKSWLEDYSLGQLWEKNELGGCPTPEQFNTESN